MQPALDAAAPEFEESVQVGKFGRHVIVLPYIGLEEIRMVGEMVKDLGRGETVALELRYQAGHVSHPGMTMITRSASSPMCPKP
jgi:hypothetical protein